MKQVILTIIFFTVANFLCAQKISGIVGANWSEIKSENLEFTGDIGYQAGFATAYQLNGWIGIKPRIMLKRKASSWLSEVIFSDTNGNETDRLKLDTKFVVDYIELPIFLNYQIKKNLGIHFGPVFDFKIGSKILYKGKEVMIPETAINHFDYGFGIGLNYSMDELEISLEYNKNMEKIIESESNFYTFSNERFGNSFSLNLSYTLFNSDTSEN